VISVFSLLLIVSVSQLSFVRFHRSGNLVFVSAVGESMDRYLQADVTVEEDQREGEADVIASKRSCDWFLCFAVYSGQNGSGMN
jgi:hypothetical protein